MLDGKQEDGGGQRWREKELGLVCKIKNKFLVKRKKENEKQAFYVDH